jgi:type IV pilus assembly protein PilP
MRKNRVIAFLAVLTGLLATVPGCKEKLSPPAPKTGAAAKPPAALPKPLQKAVSSVVKPPRSPVNQFDFSSKRDPFRPFAAVKPVPVYEPKAQKVLKEEIPIHSYDVSQFKLIGVVTGDRENRAMVIDPARKGYVLKVGMTIGKNEGRITAITADGIDVLEQFRDDNGKIRKERIRLSLPRKQ